MNFEISGRIYEMFLIKLKHEVINELL